MKLSKTSTKVKPINDDFFVGYKPMPNKERRFLLAAIPLVIAGIGGLGALIATNQKKPDAAIWGRREVSIQGKLVKSPYPYLMVPNRYSAVGYDTVFLVKLGKYGSQEMVKDLDAENVKVTGKILSRHDTRHNYLMEITSATGIRGKLPVAVNPPSDLGSYRIRGRILDSKCHFGVMQPSSGMTHKSCASLCVRGGIPPMFVPQSTKLNRLIIARNLDTVGDTVGDAVKDAVGNAVAVADDKSIYSAKDVKALLPYMLDLIEAEGQLSLVHNHYEFAINPASVKVIASC